MSKFIKYEQAIVEIRSYLKSLPRGGLKKLSTDISIDYKTLVKIKNDKLNKITPLAVQKILSHIHGVEIKYKREHLFFLPD